MHRDPIDSGRPSPSGSASSGSSPSSSPPRPTPPNATLWRIATAIVTFCTLGIPVLALVRGGFARLGLAPPADYFLMSALLGSISEGRLALYTIWMPGLGSSEPLESAPWLRAAMYFVLLALPVLALTSRTRRPAISKPDFERMSALIVTGSAVTSFVLTYGAFFGQSLLVPTLGALVAGGLLLALRVGNGAVAGVVVGVFASRLFVYLISIAMYGGEYLNLMDAILTWVGRANGTLEEANPIVAWSGLVPKVLLVGTLSAFIYRLRSRWLVILVGVFAGLILYHLGGLVL